MTDKLPWICPEHPKAEIRHTWDQTHWVLNGYPAGTGIKSKHRYECAECGLELAEPTRKEAEMTTNTTTRAEHLAWCKQRALEYCDRGDLASAWASMASDMDKHEETRNHAALNLGHMMLFGGMLNTEAEMRHFINGFN